MHACLASHLPAEGAAGVEQEEVRVDGLEQVQKLVAVDGQVRIR